MTSATRAESHGKVSRTSRKCKYVKLDIQSTFAHCKICGSIRPDVADATRGGRHMATLLLRAHYQWYAGPVSQPPVAGGEYGCGNGSLTEQSKACVTFLDGTSRLEG